ncbi:MAG: hypothetical protein KatS3mg110_3467 [Pirellulaceae bacterium]|nr:MAG: hypothetical protein KatS3mg110_3467 [Pirellulaceae bacterium]
MSRITYGEATVSVLLEKMRADPRLCLIGLRAAPGGHLQSAGPIVAKDFPKRVQELPSCERSLVGLCLGASLAGARPVVDLLPADWLLYSLGDLIYNVNPISHLTGGRVAMAPVVRALVGTHLSSGPFLSGTTRQVFRQLRGWRIGAPMSIQEGCAMLASALTDQQPTLLLEHRRLFELSEDVATYRPSDEELSDIWSRARVLTSGDHLTIVAYGFLSQVAFEAAQLLERQRVLAETIHLASLAPCDRQTLVASVAKTGKLVLLEDTPPQGSLLDGLLVNLLDYVFEWLDAPVLRIHNPSEPPAYSPALERYWQPAAETVAETIRTWFTKQEG